MSYRNLLTYGFLGASIAFINLFLYVFLPKVYTDYFNITLAKVGFILIASRFIDAFLDPIIGTFSDSLAKKFSRKRLIVFGLFSVLFFYLGLLFPIGSIEIWLFCVITLAYLSLSFLTINVLSIVPEFSHNKQVQLKLNSAREMFSIIGVFAAITIPNLLLKDAKSTEALNFLVFLGLAIFCTTALVFLFFNFKRENKTSKVKNHKITFLRKLAIIAADKPFLKLMLINFVNNVVFAITASTLVFYVDKVLNANDKLSGFFLVYFLASFIFIGILSKLAQKFGKVRIWKITLVFSVLSFIGTLFLTAENAKFFYIICLLSGVFLGADLFVPPTLFTSHITKYKKEDLTGIYSGLWIFNIKLALAIGGGGALIIIGAFWQNYMLLGLSIVSVVYAFIPCILKLMVLVLLKDMKDERV